MHSLLLLAVLAAAPLHAQAPPAPAVPPVPPAAEAAAPRLHRDDLVAEVLARNPRLDAARSALEAVQARTPQVGTLPDPMLEVMAAPLTFGGGGMDPGLTVQASQVLPAPGTLRLARTEVRARAAAEAGDLEALRQELALAAVTLFDRLWWLDRALAVNAEHQALVAGLGQAAEGLYAAGTASLQDPLQAREEQVRLEIEAGALAAERQRVVARVNALRHAPPDQPLPIPADPPEPELPAPAERPELVAAGAMVEAAEAALAVARRGWWPEPRLMGQYSSMWAETPHRWMAGVGLEIPLQVGRIQGRIQEADARLAEARAEVSALRDTLAAEEVAARAALTEARERLRLYRDRLVPLAQERVEAARAGFTAGRDSFLTVIEAARGLREAQLGLLRARADVATEAAALARTRGALTPFEDSP